MKLLALFAAAGVAILASLIAFDHGGPTRIAAAANAPIRAELHRRIAMSRAPARDLAFSPDGQRLAASSADGAIRLWRVAERGPPRLLTHDGGVASLAMSADLLATGGYDGSVKLWRVADGKLLRTLSGHRGTVWAVDISPGGMRVASGGEDRQLRLWRTGDGSLAAERPGHELNIWSIRFSPDGNILASASFDRSVRLWDGASGAPRRSLEGHGQAVVGIDISPDGALLASGSDDSTVRLWRLADGASLATLRGSSHVYGVAFSPDGRWLASAGRAFGALRTLWHQATGIGAEGPAVRLWQVSSGRVLQTLDHPGDAHSLAFSPDGRFLAIASEDGSLSIWRLRSR